MKLFRILGIALTVFILASTLTPLWNVLGNSLSVSPVIGQAEVIVVLGGGVDGTNLGLESLRRAVHGIELYKEGFAPRLVVSGPADPKTPDRSEAQIRKEMAIRMGVPADRIVTMADVFTTREEAQHTAAAIVTDGGTILLVTGSLHMRRAMGVFQRAGLKVMPAPSDDWPRYASAPEARITLLRQTLEQAGGLLYYRLFGYI